MPETLSEVNHRKNNYGSSAEAGDGTAASLSGWCYSSLLYRLWEQRVAVLLYQLDPCSVGWAPGRKNKHLSLVFWQLWTTAAWRTC